MKDNLMQQSILDSRGDALYIGTIYLGSPQSQPVRVAFDTGSEFLTVTSSLCSDDTTPEQFRFKKFNVTQNKFVERSKLKDRCPNSGYDIAKSESQKILTNQGKKVSYGSADLQGFIFEDYACILANTRARSESCSN
jgi:hypothetical protein